MMANGSDTDSAVRSDLEQAWWDAWHLWRIIIPRRSITGRLVWGTVWRRYRAGRWVYKNFVEYSGVQSGPFRDATVAEVTSIQTFRE